MGLWLELLGLPSSLLPVQLGGGTVYLSLDCPLWTLAEMHTVFCIGGGQGNREQKREARDTAWLQFIQKAALETNSEGAQERLINCSLKPFALKAECHPHQCSFSGSSRLKNAVALTDVSSGNPRSPALQSTVGCFLFIVTATGICGLQLLERVAHPETPTSRQQSWCS